MILKIEKNHHLKVCYSVFIVFTLLFIVLIYFNFEWPFLISGAFFFLLDALPALYMHAEYYGKNKGQTIELFPDRLILHDKDGSEKVFPAEEMRRVVLYKAASMDKGGIPISSIEHYQHAYVYLKNGERLVITCLMAPDLEKAVRKIRGVPYERKKQLTFIDMVWGNWNN